MLRELRDVRQIPGESHRRCFTDDVMDLTVWVSEKGEIRGIELCYDKGKHERAARWTLAEGFVHQKVDDGERGPYEHKATPILVPDGEFPASKISRLFQMKSRDIDRPIADFVLSRLSEYPE